MASWGWPWAGGSAGLRPLSASQAGGAERPEQAAQALPEHAVGEAVDEAIAEAVADSQPRGEEGGRAMAVQSGTLQQEVEDVGHPQDVEDAGDAEQHHGVALIRATLTPLALLGAEAGVALSDLAGMLPADAEYTPVGEADGESGRRVQQHHDEGAEARVGLPRCRAPSKYVPMVPRLPPAKEGRQEDEGRVEPDEGDADTETAWRHQGGVGERPCDGDVAVHADARQWGHGHTLKNGDQVAEHLTGELLVQPPEVVEQGQGGHQAADPHQKVCIGHGLDEVAGGVVVEERGTVEDKDDYQVASDDEDREEEDDGHL